MFKIIFYILYIINSRILAISLQCAFKLNILSCEHVDLSLINNRSFQNEHSVANTSMECVNDIFNEQRMRFLVLQHTQCLQEKFTILGETRNNVFTIHNINKLRKKRNWQNVKLFSKKISLHRFSIHHNRCFNTFIY